MFGSLLSTMQEFSKQTTRMLVTYIEFNNSMWPFEKRLFFSFSFFFTPLDLVSISLVYSEKEALYCVLFHDVDDGAVLGEAGRTIVEKKTQKLTSFEKFKKANLLQNRFCVLLSISTVRNFAKRA
jgi:hypothetical protein